MHLFRRGAVGVHACLLSSGVHRREFLISHDGVSAHKVDALEDAYTASLQTLELYRLLVLAILILFHVDNIIWELYSEATFSEDARRVLLVYSAKEEVMRAVGDWTLVPRQRSSLGRRALDGEVVDPALAIRRQLDVERRVVNLLELSPVMEFVLVPFSLILLQVEVVHGGLPNFVVCRTSLDDLALVLIIEGQVEIAQTGLSIQSGADVGQEGTNRGNVDGISNLLGKGDGSDGHDVAGEEQVRHEVGDLGPGRAVEDVADPQNGLEDGMADGEEDPKVEGGGGIGRIGHVGLHLADGLEEVGPSSAVDGDAANTEGKCGKAEDIGRDLRQGTSVFAATGHHLRLGIRTGWLLHPGRHLEQLHKRIGESRISFLAHDGLGRMEG
mmetsp:Transcript_10690/g.25199  ORF Transcript_10690/g.25199 Transcript_10690/m.25199 type:complete len:385 (-) Transcript_10690:1959-3113(-)